jgi:hypothetical protein
MEEKNDNFAIFDRVIFSESLVFGTLTWKIFTAVPPVS